MVKGFKIDLSKAKDFVNKTVENATPSLRKLVMKQFLLIHRLKSLQKTQLYQK